MLLLRCRIIPNPPHFGGVRDLLSQLRSGDLQMGAPSRRRASRFPSLTNVSHDYRALSERKPK